MKIALYILLVLIGVVMVLFFVLGKKSQSGTAPGLVDGKLSACSAKPNCVCSEDGTDAKHVVEAFPASSWTGLVDAIQAQGGTITHQDKNYIAAEYKSKLYGFVDDVEARKASGTVHIRSASRVGYSDRGVNKARVEALRSALTKD
jgi:uncharacterized protein (DUF1499 family)